MVKQVRAEDIQIMTVEDTNGKTSKWANMNDLKEWLIAHDNAVGMIYSKDLWELIQRNVDEDLRRFKGIGRHEN